MMPFMMLDERRHHAHPVGRRAPGGAGADAGGRHDGLHAVRHADRLRLPDALHALHHVPARRRVGPPRGRCAGDAHQRARSARAAALPRAVPTDHRVSRRLLPLPRRRRLRAPRPELQDRGRPDGGHHGHDRLGQVHGGQPDPALLRRDRGRDPGRRRGHPPGAAQGTARQDRLHPAAQQPVHRHHREQPALRRRRRRRGDPALRAQPRPGGRLRAGARPGGRGWPAVEVAQGGINFSGGQQQAPEHRPRPGQARADLHLRRQLFRAGLSHRRPPAPGAAQGDCATAPC
jgi:hypothetical protein